MDRSKTAVFLIRCWGEPQTQTEGDLIWRYRLEDVRTGQHDGFTDLANLFAFMESHLATINIQNKEQNL